MRHCDACGKVISANKRKCLKCIDIEIDLREKIAAFKGEAIGQANPYSGYVQAAEIDTPF